MSDMSYYGAVVIMCVDVHCRGDIYIVSCGWIHIALNIVKYVVVYYKYESRAIVCVVAFQVYEFGDEQYCIVLCVNLVTIKRIAPHCCM